MKGGINMGLLSWLGNRLRGRNEREQTPTPPTVEPATPTTELHSNAEPPRFRQRQEPKPEPEIEVGKLLPQVQEKRELAAPSITITFIFIDETKTAIQVPDRIVGVPGQRVRYQIPEFDGYYFTGVTDLITIFPDKNAQIVVSYARIPGAPVQIYYVNYDTGQPMKPMTVLSGIIGDSYAAEPHSFSSFRLIQSTGATKGVFTEKTKQIVFFYRQSDWRTVQPVHQFVKLNSRTTVYTEPNGATLPVPLPAQLVLRVFTKITTTDERQWFNIGGEQWLGDDTDMVDVSAPQRVPKLSLTQWTRTPLRTSGIVNIAVNTTIATYQVPNGEQLEHLKNGEQLKIIAEAVDDQQVVWYQLADRTYVPGIFVDLDE